MNMEIIKLREILDASEIKGGASYLIEGKPSVDGLEGALLDVFGSNTPPRNAIAYLCACHQRARGFSDLQDRFAAFLGLLITEDLPGCPQKRIYRDLRVSLAQDQLPQTFLKSFVQSLIANETIEDALAPIVQGVATAKTSGKLSLDDYGPAFTTLVLLAKAGAGQVLTNRPDWLVFDAFSPRDFEARSLFGRFLSLGVRHDHEAFQNLRTKTKPQVDGSTDEMRMKLNQLFEQSAALALSLLQSSSTKEQLLQFIIRAIAMNKDRAKIQFNPHLVSSDQFFMNLNRVCLALCKPFFQKSPKRARPLLKLSYTIHGRLGFEGETRLVPTTDTSSIASEHVPLLTELIFSTLWCLRVGVIKSFTIYEMHLRELSERQQLLSRLTRSSNPRDAEILQNESMKVDRLYGAHLAFKTQLLNPEMLQDIVDFYQWIGLLLVDLIEDPLDLPIQILPEFIVSNMIDFFIYLGRFDPDFLHNLRLDNLLTFVIAFISPNSPLHNPHLRGKLPELLVMFLPNDHEHLTEPPRNHVFGTHPALLNHLVQALLELFVAVEFTGRSNQFYEKFSSRHIISELLEFLWLFPEHRNKFREISSSNSFISFINMLSNDAVWLLDQSIESLTTIRNEEMEMDNQENWVSQPFERQREREEQFARTESSTSSNLRLANEQIRTILYLSSDSAICSVFLSDHFVSRMAETLTYYLNQLLGPQVTNLNVKDPTKYNFRPRELLTDIVTIFINFASHEEHGRDFVQSVASDERSYDANLFKKAARFFRKKGLLPSSKLAQFDSIVRDIESVSASVADMEELLGDIPDQFLDPLMMTLMKDPVLLPTSKVIMDRPVITRHLMNNPTDPFNRQPLSIDELSPADDLKKEMDEWIASKMKK